MINLPQHRLFNWIGGKSWLKEELYLQSKKIITEDTNRYIEPFAGGLGSFLAIYPNIKNIEEIIINDINPLIIETYKQIKNNPKNIINRLKNIESDFHKTIPNEAYKLHKTKDKEELKPLLKNAESFFKEKREEFNNLKTKKINEKTISIFLFLTEHAFNGVYRENSKGGYNSPFNWDNKKNNIERKEKTIIEHHNFFNSINIIFENMDVFELIKKYPTQKTFIYLDPPYLNEDSGENKYSKEHFTKELQVKLLNEILKYEHFLYSNHNTETIINFLNKNNIEYIKIARKNIISSSKESRKKDIYEVLAFK